jgi:hypothetical protein
VESKLGPLGTSATEWPIVPAPGDYDNGEIGGIKIGRGNQRTRRKPDPAPLCPPQIPLDQTRARTQAGGKPGTNRLSYGAALHRQNEKKETSAPGKTFEGTAGRMGPERVKKYLNAERC